MFVKIVTYSLLTHLNIIDRFQPLCLPCEVLDVLFQIHDKDGAPLACCVIGWGKENAVHASHGHHSHDHDSTDHDHHGHGSHHGHMKKQV